MWLVGLFSRSQPAQSTGFNDWRFYDLTSEGVTVASSLGGGSELGWWALMSATPQAGARLFTLAPELGESRRLSTSAEIAQEIDRSGPGWGAPVVERVEIVAMTATAPSVMKPSALVRRATMGDLRGLMTLPIAVEDQTLDQARAVLASRINRGEVFIISQNGVILAMAEGLKCGRYIDVQHVYTRPDSRRRGYAAAMISTICYEAAQKEMGVCLCVEATNESAIRLYKRLGFDVWWHRVDLLFARKSGPPLP